VRLDLSTDSFNAYVGNGWRAQVPNAAKIIDAEAKVVEKSLTPAG
jgi:hypothetical protein